MSIHGPAIADEPGGVAGVLWRRAAAVPRQLAAIENDRGRWRTATTSQLAERIACLALGLSERGVGDGDRVAMLIGSRVAWMEVDLAVQSAGGVAVALPDDDDDEALAQLLEGLGLAAAVVDDPLTIQRLNSLVDAGRADPIPHFLLLGQGDETAEGTDQLIEDGRRDLARRPTAFADLLGGRDPAQPAAITFTAGAGGRPRPVVHSGSALLAGARQVAAARRLEPRDVGVVAFHPAHPFERAVTIYPAIVGGAVLAFPESDATIARAILEVRPTFAHLPVDRLREAAASVRTRFERNRGFKRVLASWWRRSLRADRPPSLLGHWMIGAPVRRTLGWDNLRSLIVTSVEVPPDIAATIKSLGLEVEEGYAVVEAGLVGIRRHGPRFEPLDGTTVSERDGTLLVRSPAARDELSTGDVGRASGTTFEVDGPLASRLTVGGTTILAADVERRLRQSPFIALAVVTADAGRVHAAIEVDRGAVSAWAADRGLHFTTYSSLVSLTEVGQLIADEVARLAGEVASHDLLHRPLQQGREITRTRTTVHRRPNTAGVADAPAALAEPASALE